MDKDKDKQQDKEQEYMKTSEQELEKKQPMPEKEGLEQPRKTGYKPLQLGMIIFAIAVLVIVGFAIGFDWFGLFGTN
ncbi:hypothetical protein [Planococcus sp. ISL-109]|uniref:hypothetical protein n=1 Tax=Planococcus sp. ISL-109 TaxID=2819166 RepID=UPI001BE786AF|nr:hypothetical protein [Planococcus sp. ISL-109]MBT2582684.1 hypothetical protein [Planococcus sp. ISL-109]